MVCRREEQGGGGREHKSKIDSVSNPIKWFSVLFKTLVPTQLYGFRV